MMPISIAPLLKQQSQSRHFGHGWIQLQNGRRWCPTQDQKELLAQLTTAQRESIGSKAAKWLLLKLRVLCR